MASEPQDPENYSLDEIIARLKSRGIESEPELVTREDGTQVYRVRKRKRRSRQPHKEQQRRKQRTRAIQLASLVILLMLTATGVIGLFAYYNSRGFNDKLRSRISERTGAEVEFEQLRMTPVRVTALGARLGWPPSNPLQELVLRNVSADLRVTSFIGAAWSGEEVFAQKGNLRIAMGLGRGDTVESSLEGSMRFAFGRYRCADFGLQFGAGNRPPLRCDAAEASFYMLRGAGQLRLNGGTVSADGWPALPLERGLIEFRDGQVVVSSLRLSSGLATEGYADLSGTIDPRSRQPAYLTAQLDEFPFQLLAGKSATRLFSLRLDSEATLSFVPGEFGSHELVAPFESTSITDGAVVQGFPFLGVLRRELQEDSFGARPFTTEVEGLLRRTAASVSLEHLRLAEKNFLALRGDFRIDRDDKVSGTLDLGVAERLVGRHPSPLFARSFDRVADGYHWAAVKLSGTVAQPIDDFEERLRRTAAAGAAGGAGAPDGTGDALENQFRDLIDGGAPGGAGGVK